MTNRQLTIAVLVVAVITCMFMVSGCFASDKEGQELSTITDQAWQDFEDGKLTQAQLQDILKRVQDARSQDVPWWEIIGAVVAGVALRGIPSKGPLTFIASLFGKKK